MASIDQLVKNYPAEPSLLPAASPSAPGTMSAADFNKVAAVTLAQMQALPSMAAEFAAGMDLREKYIRRGSGLAGIATPAAFWEDYILTNGTAPLGNRSTGAGGSIAMSMTYGTAVDMATSAGGGGYAIISPNGSGLWMASSLRTSRWYVSAKIVFTSSYTSGDLAGIALWDSTSEHKINLGAVGAVSTTNFAMTGAGATLDTAIAIDSNAHILEMYRADGNIHVCIDGVDVGDVAVPATWTGGTLLQTPYLYNGGTAGDRKISVLWVCALLGDA